MRGRTRELKTLGWYFLIALTAEAAASYWTWNRAPTHSIRDCYAGGFWAYGTDRLVVWLVCFTFLAAVRLIKARPATES